jgi:hypothetical protein
VLEGVLDQGRQHLSERARGRQHEDTGRHLDHEASVRLLERRAPLLALLREHVSEMHRLRRTALRPTRPGQQVVHDGDQAFHLLERDPRLVAHVLTVGRDADLLQPHRQGGQRRPQLV